MAAAQPYLEALRERDDRGIRDIYEAFAPAVRQWVCNNSGTPSDAQDLFQEALIAIYDRYCLRGEAFRGSFGGLLMTICKRRWYDRLSGKKQDEGIRNAEASRYEDEAEAWETAGATIQQQERQQRLEQLFQYLSEQCRKVLTLLMTEGLTVEETAEHLGISSANTVYQNKHRCLSRWRQLYFEQYND